MNAVDGLHPRPLPPGTLVMRIYLRDGSIREALTTDFDICPMELALRDFYSQKRIHSIVLSDPLTNEPGFVSCWPKEQGA